MRTIGILFFLTVCNAYNSVYGQKTLTDSLLKELNQVIKESRTYDSIKEKRIYDLKDSLSSSNDLNTRYDIANKLYKEYKSYQFDSALIYSLKLQKEAKNKGNPSEIDLAKLNTAFVLLSGGLFKETFDSLGYFSIGGVENSIKAEYYTIKAIANYNIADYNTNVHFAGSYRKAAHESLRLAVQNWPVGTFEHNYYNALWLFKVGRIDTAFVILEGLLRRPDLTYHQIAIVSATLSGVLIEKGDAQGSINYLIKAAIADTRASVKEAMALTFLAGTIYNKGYIDEATDYIKKANEDASFYDSRLRKVQVGRFLPSIEGEMKQTIRNQKKELQHLLQLISLLAIFLAGLTLITFRQIKKSKIARVALSDANEELKKASTLKEEYNDQLQIINNKLSEVNKIKEEYIGYYFTLDTAFISRIEKKISATEKKILERKWDEARFILNSIDLKKEKNELLANFDSVFLKLFPNFVAQFNLLFNEEDRIVLKDGQLLNTELRIFALIRLGITQNEKIAEILDYSINTVYAKKTKIRSKTIVNKDDFEEKLMEITAVKL